MNAFKNLYKFLKSPAHICLSLVITIVITYIVYFFRNILLLSYKFTNLISCILLLLCALNVFLVYKDPSSKTKTLFMENVAGIIFFIGYIICKLTLRG